MEEKIIEAKFIKNTKAYAIGAVGALAIIISVLMAAKQYPSETFLWYYKGEISLGEYIFERFLSTYFGADVFVVFWLGIAGLIVFCSLLLMMNRCSLAVSNTRVVGKASFGKQVDLPINQISAIGLGVFSSVFVATSAGHVHFWLIENRSEVHAALNELLGKFQTDPKNGANITVPTASNADELKKYKELLDSGVITQEEFDAKKKQLLGL